MANGTLDPLNILTPRKTEQADPLGILKKKANGQPLNIGASVGGTVGTSKAQSELPVSKAPVEVTETFTENLFDPTTITSFKKKTLFPNSPTPILEEVAPEPEILFSGDDKVELTRLTTKYNVTPFGVNPLNEIKKAGGFPVIEEETSYRPFLAELSDVNQIESRIQGELNSIKKAKENAKLDVTKSPGLVSEKEVDRVKELNEELKAVQILKKKAAAELTIEGEDVIEAKIRTNNEGNLLNTATNRLAAILPASSVAGMVGLSQETSDRIDKLPTQFITGLNYLQNVEPVIFERITDALKNGLPISESQVATITQQGIELEQARLVRALQRKEITPLEYQEKVLQLNTVRKHNLLDNQEVIRAFLSDGAATILDEMGKAKQGNNPLTAVPDYVFGHTWNYSDAEIQYAAEKYAKDNGLDPQDGRIQSAIRYLQDNEGAMIMENSIAKAGGVRELFKGLSEPIRGISASAEDLAKSSNDVYIESQSQGNVNVSEKRLKSEDTGVRSIVNDVVKGTGQFVTQAGIAYLTSGAVGLAAESVGANVIGRTLLGTKDGIATYITSYAQVYDSNLKNALNYTSDNQLAKQAAAINSSIEGATELFLSPLDIAKGIASKFRSKGTTEGLLKILSEKNLTQTPDKLRDFLTATLKGVGGTAKVAGAEIGEEWVTNIADYVTNAYLNPNSETFQNRDLQNELAITAYQTGVSMAIPALLNGVGAANANTFSKGALLVAAQNRQKLIEGLDQDLALDNIDQAEYNQKAQIINTAEVANAELPLKSDGNKLNTDEKADYIFSRVSEDVMKNKIEKSKDEAEKRILEVKIKEQQDFRTELLGTSILSPTINNNESEESINQNGGQDGNNEATQSGSLQSQNAEERQPEEIINNTASDNTGAVSTIEPDITVGEMLDKTGTYNGEKGSFLQDGQTVIFKVEGKNKEYELGNIDEVQNNSIKDYGIVQEQSVVAINDEGGIKVRDIDYQNNFSDPLAAINRDANGNIVSVNLETTDGKKRTFRGNIAEDIAYQINLKEINKDNETRTEFEQFINEDGETSNQMEVGGLSETIETGTSEDNAEVSREKIEPKYTVENFAERIATGEQMTSPEDLQFYDNNKAEIENVLKERVAAENKAPITNETETDEIPVPETEDNVAEPTVSEATPTAETGEEGGNEPPLKDIEIIENMEGRDLSGIRKALVSDEIIAGVDLERIGDKEMMALGRKILDTGEVKPEALVIKIITEKTGVLTPTEVVALITYKRDIDNALQDTYKKINDKRANGEDIGTLGVEAKNLERQISDFDVMAVITAQQQSMAFRLRQRMLDRDYNVVTQIELYKKNNNGEIPADIEAKFRDLDRQLKEVKAKLAEAEKIAEERESQDAVNNIKESVDRETVYTDEELDKKIQEGVEKEISKLYEELPAEKKSAADKAISALEKFRATIKTKTYDATLGIPVAIVDLGAATAIRAIKVGKSVAEAVRIGIKRIKDALKETGVDTWYGEDAFTKDMTEFLEAEGVSTKNKPKDKPTINDDGTVSIPNEMLRDLVRRGITDINDLVDEVHRQVVATLPNVTTRQVRDYITDYGKQINPTADELQTQVNTAKRVGRLLSELEDVQNKIKKTTGSKFKLTEKERELKRQINSLSKDIFPKEEKTDEQKLSDAKERIKARIAELTRRIKNKDFAKPVKKIAPNDTELVNLNTQKEKLQEQFDDEQYKLELKNRTFWQKAEDWALELTSGLVRGLVASLDMSAGFVQGIWRIFSNPVNSAKGFGTMFRHFGSEKASQEYLTKIKSSPAYNLMKASGLALDDKSGKVSAKEGFFISNWVNLIYDFIAKVVTLNYKPATQFLQKINPYKASQRAFDGYVNSIRVSSFTDLAKSMERDGYTFEAYEKDFKKAADFVNSTTGRGSLGKADASSRWLNIFFFAPRKVISEIKLFTPYAFVYYARMPKSVRKKALINLGRFLGGFMLTNGLLWASRYDDDDEEKDNFWNPNSSEFLTHKFGNKRITVAGGARSMIVFQSRLWSGKFIDQYGKESKLGERFGKPINSRLDLVWRFVLGKASPAASVIAKKLDEKKNIPVDDAEIIKDLSVPIWLQDLKELYKDSPVEVSTILSVFSFFGANVRTVDESKRKVESFKIYKEGATGADAVRESTPEEYKMYTEEKENAAAEKLQELDERGTVWVNKYGEITVSEKEKVGEKSIDELTEDELKDVKQRLKTQAANEVKKTIKF